MFIPGGSAIPTSGYDINNSVRLRRSASATLSRTPGASGNQKTYTFSFWYKRGLLTSQQGLLEGYVNSGTLTSFNINNDTFNFQIYNSPSYNVVWATTAVFRDPSAWYHVVLTIDTTQASQANMAKLYVNGVQQTFSYTNYIGSIAQNTNTNINASGTGQYIGVYNYNGSYQDGYLAEVNFIDGQALTPSSFGATDAVTGVWAPAAYTGSYGTNGFYLKFSDIATTSGSNAGLGKDFSGNSNYWTTNNISVTSGTTYDSMTDVPTLSSPVTANYAVLNPLDKGTSGTLDRANLQWSSGASWQSVRGTMTIPSGKFYFEGIITSTTTASLGQQFGLALATNPLNVGGNSNTGAYGVDCTSSSNVNTAGTYTGSGSAFTAGDVLQIAIDRDNNRAWFGRNNTWYNSTLAATGDPVAGTNATWSSLPADLFPFINTYSQTVNFNFGQRPFSYTPPAGYVALNTYNLPTPTILQGNKYMDATLYTGNGSTQTITNAAGFKPDLVWVKNRTSAASNVLMDSVRGITGSGYNTLFSDLTAGDYNSVNQSTWVSTYGYLSTLNSNGFSIVSGSAANANFNSSSNNYVGWQWQAGQGSTSSNTSGSITSTVSVNATAGFSVVTYTGTGSNATVGHGLGVAPSMVIIKNRTGVNDWVVGQSNMTSWAYAMNLNRTDAQTSVPAIFNSTAPTSTVFSIGTNAQVNTSSSNYVAYCWAGIAGFSKFGSYTGNGSADGTFVYTGFRPKWIMIKRTDSTSNWAIMDEMRIGYNVSNYTLYSNLSGTEQGYLPADILSNGFKLRDTGTDWNASGGTYIYAAFAENPFKNALAR